MDVLPFVKVVEVGRELDLEEKQDLMKKSLERNRQVFIEGEATEGEVARAMVGRTMLFLPHRLLPK